MHSAMLRSLHKKAWSITLNKSTLNSTVSHIINMVAIYDAPSQVVQDLAARPDVAHIIGNP